MYTYRGEVSRVVDGDTLEDGTVTVRDRDTGHQERIDKSRCLEYLRDRMGNL